MTWRVALNCAYGAWIETADNTTQQRIDRYLDGEHILVQEDEEGSLIVVIPHPESDVEPGEPFDDRKVPVVTDWEALRDVVTTPSLVTLDAPDAPGPDTETDWAERARTSEMRKRIAATRYSSVRKEIESIEHVITEDTPPEEIERRRKFAIERKAMLKKMKEDGLL